jgi:DNA-binding NarL/FixJ family response regulator
LTRVVLADDQQLVRAGFRLILTSAEIEVVGEATTGEEAVEVTRRTAPDVVLMDIRMPETDGIEATRRIVNSDGTGSIRVLILTTFDLDEYVYDALHAGAIGFLLKDAPPEHLVAAVESVVRGDTLLAPSITRRLVEEFAATRPRIRPQQLDQLSVREAEVFGLVARGLSNREISEQLFVGETTVKTHIARIFAKLEVRDRVQAVVLAYEAGVVRPGRD